MSVNKIKTEATKKLDDIIKNAQNIKSIKREQALFTSLTLTNNQIINLTDITSVLDDISDDDVIEILIQRNPSIIEEYWDDNLQ